MVAAIILAAGRSSRMGRPKALLRQIQSGRSFVSHLIQVAASASLLPVLVVGRPEHRELISIVEGQGATFVPNPDADRGQLSSLLAGLAVADDANVSAIVVMPVDVPLVTTSIVVALVKAAGPQDVMIVRAAHNGRHGHPVLFKRPVFDELRRADPAVGAKGVVRADLSRVRDLEVGDAGVTLDVDTPQDYLRAFGRAL